MSKPELHNDVLQKLKSPQDLRKYLSSNNYPMNEINHRISYLDELEVLQIELLQLLNWVKEHKKRVVIVFEGRDAAGKGGSINRFTRYLNPRHARVVALGKPTDIQKQEWYFRRYVKELPHPGQIVFFDRSWYNRAVVEPVMGFCTEKEYNRFMLQVPEFEHMLYEDGVQLIKLWFDISKKEQEKRFKSRLTNPLKQWKISPVDLKSVDLWDDYAYHIQEMFTRTHTDFAPWTIVKTDVKKVARLESMKCVLSKFPYKPKKEKNPNFLPDPNIIHRYFRSSSMD